MRYTKHSNKKSNINLMGSFYLYIRSTAIFMGPGRAIRAALYGARPALIR